MKLPEFNNRQLITFGIGAAIVIVIIVLLAVYWNKIRSRIADRRLERSFEQQITASEVTLTEFQANR